MIAPGSWLGVIGGGQLGRMFAHAAQRMGYRVAVFDPEPLLVGLALLAIAGAVLTYFGVQLAWRIGVLWKMAARRTPAGS